MVKRVAAAACLLALLFGAGCSYLQNRTNDLLDVFWVDLDAGLLASSEVRVTDFCAIGIGLGVQSLPICNLHGRYIGRMERGTGGIPVYWLFNMYSLGQEANMVPCLEGSGEYTLAMQPPPANYLLFYPGEFFVGRPNYAYGVGKRGWRVADVAVGGSLLLGLRVGLSPGEFLDFLAGLCGLDLAGDDAFPAVGTAPRPAEAALR